VATAGVASTAPVALQSGSVTELKLDLLQTLTLAAVVYYVGGV
jgi:hypothetical protein